jgi:DNA-binding transcriptional MerR regulator
MAAALDKAAGAFRTIGEVSRDTGLPQHILRYWETRFPQLKPLQRAGGRRYYRPSDIALVERINTLLNQEGYTVRGVQKLLSAEGRGGARMPSEAMPAPPPAHSGPVTGLRTIRDGLARALSDD